MDPPQHNMKKILKVASDHRISTLAQNLYLTATLQR